MIFWEAGRKFEVVFYPTDDDEEEWFGGESLELIEHTDKGEDCLFVAFRSDEDHKVEIEVRAFDIAFPVMQEFVRQVQRQLIDPLPVKTNSLVPLSKMLDDVYALPSELTLFLEERPWHLNTMGAILDTRGVLLPDEMPFAKARYLHHVLPVKELVRMASRLYRENEDATPQQLLDRLIVAKAMG